MSAQHVAAALRARTRDSDAKLVLLSLAHHANDQALTAPKASRVESETQLDAGTIARAIEDLKADRLVERHGQDRTGITVWKVCL